ncbi:MAG TPA: hypothetical protein VMU70_00185 [Candidatus Tyrphobacter sp.]|nr:hypothetical protein [Candidatus Tyrphobacter sp.]
MIIDKEGRCGSAAAEVLSGELEWFEVLAVKNHGVFLHVWHRGIAATEDGEHAAIRVPQAFEVGSLPLFEESEQTGEGES